MYNYADTDSMTKTLSTERSSALAELQAIVKSHRAQIPSLYTQQCEKAERGFRWNDEPPSHASGPELKDWYDEIEESELHREEAMPEPDEYSAHAQDAERNR